MDRETTHARSVLSGGDRRPAVRPPRGSWPFDRWLTRRIAGEFAATPLRFALWDGSEYGEGHGGERLCIHIKDRMALYRFVFHPEVQFGDLYSFGRMDVEGDLVHAVECAYAALDKPPGREYWLRRLVAFIGKGPSLSRSQRNIHHHYDIGNDFYRLWLDRQSLQYTCAYYRHPEASLEDAQVAKLEHVCRKLDLKRGDTVVEAGSGWGGFAIHMAKRFGVRVHSYNISREQVAYAREWAKREGVGDRVTFVEGDYRNINGEYDVFVSIGMLEHVGLGNYRTLGEVVNRCLKPDGRGLIHSIGRDRPAKLNAWIRRRIFPGAHPPTLAEMAPIFEPSGLTVLDVENLKPHYARTLRHWLERFEAHEDRVRDMFDAFFVRAWRLYLAGSVAAFTVGQLQLYQVLFARAGRQPLPTTRDYMYERTNPGQAG